MMEVTTIRTRGREPIVATYTATSSSVQVDGIVMSVAGVLVPVSGVTLPITDRKEKTELAGHLARRGEEVVLFVDEIIWDGEDLAFTDWEELGLVHAHKLFSVMVPPNSKGTSKVHLKAFHVIAGVENAPV
jgi:hypothetical protein